MVEFACEYCGASQAVKREGGIVTLRMLSDKIDRIQDTVDRTAAELAIFRLSGELEDLEKRYEDASQGCTNQKEMIQSLFIGLFVIACVAGVVAAAYSSSFLPVVIFAVGGGMGLFLLRHVIFSKMDTAFGQRSKFLIDKGIETNKRIIEYKKIVNL